jgi:hypothetical protein
MTFRFVSATDDKKPLTAAVSIAGGSGTGKTYSALRLARGLAGGKPFGVIDTENRRALHYRGDFPEMMHLDFSPLDDDGKIAGFPPERWIAVLDEAEKAGLPALVIDSFSHSWEGIGGVLELQSVTADAILARSPSMGADRAGLAAWQEVKPRFRRLIDRIIRARCHIVVCMRAKPVLQKRQGNAFVNAFATKLRRPDLAWNIAADGDLVFEMTASFLMVPESPGVPIMLKCADQFKGIFGPGDVMTEAAGEAMAAWANGAGTNTKAILDEARVAARCGKEALTAHWKALPRGERTIVNTIMDELRRLATEADASVLDADSPFAPPAESPDDHTAWSTGWQSTIERAETADDVGALQADLEAEIAAMPEAERPHAEAVKAVRGEFARRLAAVKGALV